MLEHGTIRSLFLRKLQQIRPVTLLKLDSNIDVFLRNLWKIFKNTYFEEHLPTDASTNERQHETHTLPGKKSESHLVTPENYSYFNSTKLLN